MEVTLYGWKLLVLIDARTKIPLAAQVVPIQEHETLCLRALVTQARTNVGGKARRHKVVFDSLMRFNVKSTKPLRQGPQAQGGL